jgi:hypothetical protein
MKKILRKYRGMSSRDNLPMAGRHIHSLRIRAFANEDIKFTEEEDAHFDACRLCRLEMIEALKNLTPVVVTTTVSKAA